MSAISSRIGPFLQRQDVRLAAFGVSAVVAVFVGFIAVSVKQAEMLVRNRGYYVMLATVALFGWSWWKMRRDGRIFSAPLARRETFLAAFAIAVFSLMAINAEPYQSKILNDEFVLQSTAFNMHYFREVATMVRGYEIDGVFVSTDNYLDKRPYFYPFLVSLAHDLSGYRLLNGYLVNSILAPLTLALAFVFGRMLAGFLGGMLALLFMGTLPLLGQNATGSGMELTNVAMILVTLVLGAAYVDRPSETRLTAFLLGAVLLAQSRYESALFVLSAALITAVGWLRERRILMPWAAIFVPLLLLPVALQNKVVSNTPVLWELNERSESRFSFTYFADNFRGAISYLFNADSERSNSVVLSTAGLIGLAWAMVMVVMRLRRHHRAGGAAVALACVGIAIVANTLLVLCYYWSRFDDPMASRFSLPLHLLMAFAAVALAMRLDKWIPATRTLLIVVAFFGTAMAAGRFSYHYYSHLGIDEIEWQRRFVNAMPPGSRLVVTGNSSVPWLLEKKPAILIGRARMVADRLQFQLKAGTYRDILVIQSLRPTTANGDHAPIVEDALPSFFKLQLVTEKRFGTRICRISRLTAVDLPSDWKTPEQLRAQPPPPAGQ
ncbi:MAG: hypothetical protein Q7S40_03955 [Opitutaceae bacterium]|nr:hypothetical protein [Opitutaceae bacterium]